MTQGLSDKRFLRKFVPGFLVGVFTLTSYAVAPAAAVLGPIGALAGSLSSRRTWGKSFRRAVAGGLIGVGAGAIIQPAIDGVVGHYRPSHAGRSVNDPGCSKDVFDPLSGEFRERVYGPCYKLYPKPEPEPESPPQQIYPPQEPPKPIAPSRDPGPK